MLGLGELGVLPIVGAVLGTVILFVALGLWVRAKRANAQAELARLLGGEQPVLEVASAQSFGIESLGVTQARGNGSLSLTPTRLIFVQWVPLRPLVIPRDKITGVETTNRHLGKIRAFARLLKVSFTNESGAPDSVAWDTPAVDPWLEALER